jgi:hypothetical protein
MKGLSKFMMRCIQNKMRVKNQWEKVSLCSGTNRWVNMELECLSNEATTSSPPKVLEYPKVAHIMQTWWFLGKGGLGKEVQGITQPIQVKERLRLFRLGANLEGLMVIKTTLQFIPPNATRVGRKHPI